MEILNYLLSTIIVLVSAMMSVRVFRSGRLTYWSGVQFGYSYFVGAPVLLSALFGSIKQIDVPIANMSISGGSGIYLVCALVACIIFIIPDKYIKFKTWRFSAPVDSLRFLYSYSIFYIIFTAYGFVSSGKLSGGHWYSSHGEAMQGDAVAVALLQIKNVMRFTLPFLLLFYRKNYRISHAVFACSLLAISVLELIVSGNRIITLTCIIAYALAYRTIPARSYVILLLAAPIIIQANSIFPIVRGMMWSDGLNYQQMSYAVKAANGHLGTAEGRDIQLMLSSSFEASNLNMANMVVDNYPSKYDYLMGDTFIVRPLTFYLPKAIWPDRPEGFGLTLGRLSGLNVDGIALNSTYIGEAYANFGPLSVFLLPLILWGLSNIFRAFDSEAVQSMAFAVGFAGWRFDLVFSVVAFLTFLAIWQISKLRVRR